GRRGAALPGGRRRRMRDAADDQQEQRPGTESQPAALPLEEERPREDETRGAARRERGAADDRGARDRRVERREAGRDHPDGDPARDPAPAPPERSPEDQRERPDREGGHRDERPRVAAVGEEAGEAHPREREERGSDEESDQQAGTAGAERSHAS